MRKAWRWLTKNYEEYHDLLAISVISLLANLGYGILNVSAIQPYAKQVGWTAQLGVIYAVFIVTEALARSPMGVLGDRIGRKPMFIGAAAVGAVTAFLWTVVPILWIILIVHAFDGVVFAAFYTTTIVAMTESVSDEKRTMSMAVFIVTLLVGMSIGPVIGGYANELTHSKLTSFYITSAALIGTAMMSIYFFPERITAAERKEEAEGQLKSILAGIWLALRAVPGYLLLSAFIYLPVGFIIPIVKLFAMSEFHFSEAEFGVAFIAGAAAVAVLSIASGWLTRTWGKNRVVQAGLVMAAVGTYLLVFIRIPWLDMIFAGLMGLGFVLTRPAWMSLYTDVAEPEVRGSIVGVMGLGQGAGLITGVLLGSYFYQSVPVNVDGIHLTPHYTPFFAMALGMTVAAILSFAFLKERTEPRLRAADMRQ